MTEIQKQLDRLEAMADKIGARADAILNEIEKAKRDDFKDRYIEIADEVCKRLCIIPKLYCYDGNKGLAGMENRCSNCPLVKGYRELCI